METYFADWGIDSETFRIVVLPLMIFFARICDVSINTIRIIFVMGGKKAVSTILGFFESLIWLLAIGQIFQHIDNIYSYIAYPAGFACGILVGMLIEERLALGKVVVRIITSADLSSILDYIHDKNIRYSIVSSETHEGEEKLLFTVQNRDNLPEFLNYMQKSLPKAFYTVESVKSASESGLLIEKPSRRGLGSWLTSIRRK
ncbi:DUF5698 domain-containing protein [Fulvivirga maritima]|uniref:DUF2179 domain-containing protein n=1 Tax=Fulvivirga maritima TaxID=2904247 RepID=UPI001F1A4C59|nr:DUF5698 domain-containing protein [Fulvivirga maritima]UII28010.1 DUF5698 domain-containing protein [Fulvivirga maritima]